MPRIANQEGIRRPAGGLRNGQWRREVNKGTAKGSAACRRHRCCRVGRSAVLSKPYQAGQRQHGVRGGDRRWMQGTLKADDRELVVQQLQNSRRKWDVL